MSEYFDTRGATNLDYTRTKRKALATESKEINMLGKLNPDFKIDICYIYILWRLNYGDLIHRLHVYYLQGVPKVTEP